MPAEPQLAPAPEAEKPPAPAQEAPQENLLKKSFGEGGLEASEKALEKAGMEKLNEMGKNLNLQAEAGAQEFGQQTKSWWERTKDKFKKKEDAPVKGEAEILVEIEKSNQAYADFKQKYQEILASGDQAGMRGLESDLSKTYEVLAAAAAKEGADESKAWKKALKTGKEPEMTVVGAQLNDVTRRLMEVRGKLGSAPSKAEAPAPAAAKEAEEEIFTEAERAQLLADAAAIKMPVAEAAPAPAPAEPEAPANPLKKNFGEGGLAGAEARLERQGVAAMEGKPLPAASSKPAERVPSLNEVLTGIPDAEPAAEAAPEAPEDFKAVLRTELERASAGLPGAKMIDDYLALEGLKADEYGTIASKAFDPRKGEIRVTYADKSELRKYSTGKMMRVYPGGKIEEIVPLSEEGSEENPILLTPEMRKAPIEGVVSGETSEPAPLKEPIQEESTIVAPEATKLDIITSEQGPTASGEIGGETELPVEEAQIIEEKPADAAAERRATAVKERAKSEYALRNHAVKESNDMNAMLHSLLDRAPMAVSREGAAVTSESDEIMDAMTDFEESRTAWWKAQEAYAKLEKGEPSAENEAVTARYVQAAEDLKFAMRVAQQFSEGMRVRQMDRQEKEEAARPASAAEAPAPAAEAPPAPAAEAAPEAVLAPTPEQMAKAKKAPLAPESLPAIVEVLQGKKFNTPGSLRDALDAAGFEFPADIEPEDPKKLHEAYKKATRPRKG